MQALFINSNSESFALMKEQSGTANLATSSYSEALKWVNDPSIPLSGIYLNPNDPTASALQFLGQAMQVRPATPFFILDEDGDFSPQNFTSLSDKFKIRGTFKGRKHLNDLLQPLQTTVPANLLAIDKRQNLQSEHLGYIAVPLVDFIYSKSYSANVFVEDDSKQLRFFAMEGSEVDLEYLSYLAKKTSWLYIEESSIESRMASFRFVDAAYLDPAYLSPSWRTAETFYRAKKFLDELRQNGTSEKLVAETYSVLQDLFQLTSQLAQDLQLRNLVEQAKRCDKAIAAVTLSVLLCKKMRFEKTSIVETLGFASLLQDISLYRTPYGNLSEIDPPSMSAVAIAHYFNHPNLSADMIAKSGNVPELTLQIIRQQHERSDRTGFPARVGGAQLQPLAEILSLINSYLDSKNVTSEYLSHYSDRVVVPFQQMLGSLKWGEVI